MISIEETKILARLHLSQLIEVTPCNDPPAIYNYNPDED